MKLLFIALCFLFVGCATPIQVNDTDYFGKIEKVDTIHIKVEEYPKPQVKAIVHEGTEYAALTKTELDKLREYKAKAMKNAESLEAVLDVTNAVIVERNLLLDAAKAQERRANMLERDYARSEEKLRQTEQTDLIEDSIYKVIILGLVLGI